MSAAALQIANFSEVVKIGIFRWQCGGAGGEEQPHNCGGCCHSLSWAIGGDQAPLKRGARCSSQGGGSTPPQNFQTPHP